MRIAALVLSVACVGLGCKPEKPAPAPPPSFFSGNPFSTAYGLRVDGKPFLARVALTETERAQGLMGVRLADGEGMLFVHPLPVRARFWMKDTPTDLDVGFFDREGRLLEVRHLRAQDTEVTESQSDQVRFALEMRHGWFAEAGIALGARLDLYDVVNAVRARGFSPTKLGL